MAADGFLVRYKLCERGEAPVVPEVEVLTTNPACNLKRLSHVELASDVCLGG